MLSIEEQENVRLHDLLIKAKDRRRRLLAEHVELQQALARHRVIKDTLYRFAKYLKNDIHRLLHKF